MTTAKIIKSYREHKSVERFFEDLANAGHKPNLLGGWVVTGHRRESASIDLIGDVYLDLCFTAPAYEFRPTIVEAIERYIKDELE